MLSYGEISHSFVKEIEKTSVSVDSYLHFTLQQINHSNKVILLNGVVVQERNGKKAGNFGKCDEGGTLN